MALYGGGGMTGSRKRLEIYREIGSRNRATFSANAGFSHRIGASTIMGAGQGVFVLAGEVEVGQIVAIYPGVVYQPYHPIL